MRTPFVPREEQQSDIPLQAPPPPVLHPAPAAEDVPPLVLDVDAPPLDHSGDEGEGNHPKP